MAGGLLDLFNSPNTQGLLGLAQGLLQAGAPSRTPVSLGQALGQGFQGAQGAYESSQDHALKKLLLQAQLVSAMKPEYKSVKSGEKLYDPATGKMILDGGPERMTPYQESMLSLAQRRLNMSQSQNNGMGKPPPGYRWNATGNEMEAIPGGPATKLSPEGAAKNAQIDNAIATIPDIKKLMVEPDMLNPAAFYASYGDVGQGRRLVKQAVEGYLRATSGAAVPETEVTRAMELYEPKPTDSKVTRERKVQQLETFLKGAGANMKKGRTLADAMPEQPQDSGTTNLSDQELLQQLFGAGQ